MQFWPRITHSGSHQAKNLMGMLLPVNYEKKMPVYHTCRKYQRDGLWADNITFPWPDQYKELQINILGCLLVKIMDSIHELKQSFLSDFVVKFLFESVKLLAGRDLTWQVRISPKLSLDLDLLTHLIGESTACWLSAISLL